MSDALVTFEIETGDFNSFKAEFAKLAKKAAKLGVEAPTYAVVEADKVYKATIDHDTGGILRPARVVQVITVSGARPKIAGWTFIVVLQHEEGGNIVRRVPGTEDVAVPLDLRTAAPACSHCGYDRRRKDTYVIAHDDGRVLQVGRTCLKDFTGHDSPEAIARWAELLGSFVVRVGDGDGEGGYGGGARACTTLADFLPYVVASIQRDGWLSRTNARDQGRDGCATADFAWVARFGDEQSRRRAAQPTNDDCARAARALDVAVKFFDDHAVDALSDYEHNLRVVVEGGSVDARTAGIAASLVNFAERLIAKALEAQKTAGSTFLGAIKDRLDVTATVARVFDKESAFGVTHIHTFHDDAGNVLTWFASSERLEVGKRYVVRGTVRAHEEFRGVKQTIVTRCACFPEGSAPPAVASKKRAAKK